MTKAAQDTAGMGKKIAHQPAHPGASRGTEPRLGRGVAIEDLAVCRRQEMRGRVLGDDTRDIAGGLAGSCAVSAKRDPQRRVDQKQRHRGGNQGEPGHAIGHRKEHRDKHDRHRRQERHAGFQHRGNAGQPLRRIGKFAQLAPVRSTARRVSGLISWKKG